MESSSVPIPDSDEQRLAELGYKQSLNRAWSGFSNFAISFTIISILAGCFTTYGQAWNNGGPIAISIGWPLISIPILIIGFCMSELVSTYPTAGGIYWWAGRLGGPIWAWFTGWFNLIGLVAVVASVDYAAATFLNVIFSLYEVNIFGVNFADESHVLLETFVLFLIILAIHVTMNVRNTHLLSRINAVSVWWHVVGVVAIVAVLIFVPSGHQSFSFVFTHRINNSGFSMGMYWFFVLPLGFLLTQYTITGYDASAHISEETHGASMTAAKGVWRSIFYSAVIGWILLLAITFAVTNVEGANEAFGFAPTLLVEALGSGWGKFVLIISTVGQLFCGAACLTSASRMCYAFSRDNGFGKRFSSVTSRVNERRVPIYAVLLMAFRALHRLRDPDLPALAQRRRLRARAVEQRQEVQVDEQLLDDLGGDHHDHLLPPVHSGSGAVQLGIQLGGVQLRAAHRRGGDPRRGDRLVRQRPPPLHRADPRDRHRGSARGQPRPADLGSVVFRG